MRILFYTASFLPTVGGAEQMLHYLASSMTARGHQATVLAPVVRNADNAVEAGYKVVRYQRPSSKRFGVRQVLLYLVREKLRGGFDVLHCHGAYPPGYVGASYKRLFDTPFVIRPHGADILPGEHIQANARTRARAMKALAAADSVVAQSGELKSLILSLGVADERIVVIPNGIQAAAYRDSRAASPFGGPYMLALGSLSPKKGFDTLIRAMAEVARLEPGLKLVIGGDGPDRKKLHELADGLGISGSVSMPGILRGEEKIGAIKGCIAGVSSSVREPFSNANLEFMAAGKPLVVTGVGGNLEVVKDGYNGLVVERGDHAGMADAMLKIYRDASLRKDMEAAASEAVKAYELERIMDMYETLYARLAGRG